MDVKEALEKFGLDKNETVVYLACLYLSSALASAVAKIANIPRASIYDILERLMQKGIVSFSIQNGKKYFSAAPPEQLIKLLEDQKTALEQALDELKILQKKEEIAPKIQVYTGKEGLKTVLNDIVRTKKTIYAYGAAGLSEKTLKWDFPKIIEARVKEGIKFKVIFDKSFLAQEKKKLLLTEVRFISKSFEDLTFTEIYGNKVAIFIYSKSPSVVLIESEEVVKSYKRYFDILWETAKK